jgi:glycosyltransferase involved in cell wall biosynthesis
MSHGGPLVSVIIANHNYARFLEPCVRSVLGQTYAHAEIIVVDDGSTDDSRAVITAFGERVRAIFQQNAGQAAALSAGFAASRGDLIALLDADDGWYAHKLEVVVETFQARPHIQWLRHKLAMVNEALEPLGGAIPVYRGSAEVPGNPLLLLESGITAGTTLVMRRALAAQVFPVVITPALALDADDTVILARIFAQRATGYSLDQVLGYYRRHAGTRFNVHDLPRLLQREAALADALGQELGYGRPSSSYKLATVIAALEGERWWRADRLGNYLRGLRSATRLWRHPALLTRQTLALTYALAAPARWLRRFDAIAPAQKP